MNIHVQFGFNNIAGLNLTLDPMGKMFQNAFSLKPLRQLKPICPGMIIGRFSTNFMFFMQSIYCGGGHLGFPIDIKNMKFVEDLPMIIPGQFGFNYPSGLRDVFFSETTNIIKAKLYMNVHCMVLYKLDVFCSDMKFKMAAMAGLSLTLDP
jgi:hypothetical protein